MTDRNARIVFEVSPEALNKIHDALGTDDATEVNQLIKEAVYQLVGATPEPSRKERQKIARRAARIAKLEREAEELRARNYDANPLLGRAGNANAMHDAADANSAAHYDDE